MIDVAIIKHRRGENSGIVSSKIKQFDEYDDARKFVEEFNKEDKEIPLVFEYATVIVNF
jgi:hypothetical protein